MSISENTLLDMSTSDLSSEDSKAPYEFVKDPDSQQFDQLFTAPQQNGAQTVVAPEKKIKDIQSYFLMRSPELIYILRSAKFNGKANGIIDDSTIRIAKLIEDRLFEILDTPKVYNKVLTSSKEELEMSINAAVNFDLKFNKTEISKDDRLYLMAKLIAK